MLTQVHCKVLTRWTGKAMNLPVGFKFGHSNRIAYVTEWRSHCVNILRCIHSKTGPPTFQHLQTITQVGIPSKPTFKNPLRMFVLRNQNLLLICDWGNSRILVYRYHSDPKPESKDLKGLKTKLTLVRDLELGIQPIGLSVTSTGTLLTTIAHSAKQLRIYTMEPVKNTTNKKNSTSG